MTIEAHLDKKPNFGDRVFVHNSAVVIGEVTLGNDVSAWPHVVVRGDVHSIEVGDRTNIQDGSVLHGTHDGPYAQGYPLIIGELVTIGHRAVVHACRIGDRCLVGMGAVIMDGAVVENQVMIAAGCLVPPGKKLESNYLYVGSPARRIRLLNDPELEFLEYSAQHYVRLKDQYLNKDSND